MRSTRPKTSRLGRGWRRRKPVLWLLVPNVALLSVVALEVVGAETGFGLDTKSTCGKYGVSCGMAGNILVAVAGGGLAYFLLRGVKVRRALRYYRHLAQTSPDRLLARGDRDRPVGRLHKNAAERLADELARPGPTRLAVVRGGPGTGRRTVLLEVARRLARKNWIPIPISLAESGSLDILPLARQRLAAAIDHLVDSDGEADAVWRQAHGTRSVVVLVEGLDRSPALRPYGRSTRNRLVRAVSEVLDVGVSIVVATDLPLPLEALEDSREDLDWLDEWAAEDYLVERLGDVDDERRARLKDVLDALTDPLEGIRALPFFLNRIAEVEKQGGLDGVTGSVHERRVALLDRWIDAVLDRKIERDALWFASDDPVLELERDRTRRRDAVEATMRLARRLLASGESSSPIDEGAADANALHDAEALGFVRRIEGRWAFPNGAVRAYFGSRDRSPMALLPKELAPSDGNERPDPRGGAWMTALLASCAAQDGRAPGAGRQDEARAACRRLLERSSSGDPRAIDAIATAAHIAQIPPLLTDLHGDIGHAAAKWSDATDVGRLKRLISALAPIDDPDVHRALWRFAHHPHYDVEWAAARALARGGGRAYLAIRHRVEDVLARAEHDDDLEAFGDEKGIAYEVGSVAWVLPSLRLATDETWQEHWERLEALCHPDRMHPLRGELSLARGLKLAVVASPDTTFALEQVRRRLGGDSAAGYWLSRLLLVQALTLHGERTHERAAVREELLGQAASDSHPFVSEAARLGGEYLAQETPRHRWSYLWADEIAAVSYIRDLPAGERLSRLAADAVLVRALVVEAARRDSARGRTLAASEALPRCLGRRLPRDGTACDCGFGLCEPTVRAAALERTPLGTSFCRQQSRLVRTLGAPAWTTGHWRRGARRAGFWLDIADELSQKEECAWDA